VAGGGINVKLVVLCLMVAKAYGDNDGDGYYSLLPSYHRSYSPLTINQFPQSQPQYYHTPSTKNIYMMKPKHGLPDTESMVKTKYSLPETKSRGIMEEVDLTSKYMFKKKQLKKSGLRTNEIKEIEPVVPLNPGMPLNPGVPLGYETYHQGSHGKPEVQLNYQTHRVRPYSPYSSVHLEMSRLRQYYPSTPMGRGQSHAFGTLPEQENFRIIPGTLQEQENFNIFAGTLQEQENFNIFPAVPTEHESRDDSY